jgi:hypothetical protein
MVESGIEPAEVAEHVVEAIRSGRFYVLTHGEMNDAIQRRAEQVIAGGPPSPALV